MAGRKPSRPQIILLLFPGSFHHFSSLAHHSFTLGHFTHSYICSRLHIIFLLSSSSPCSGPCFCQFHARPVLGESPRALETIRRLPPPPKKKQTSACNNQPPFSFLSVAIKKKPKKNKMEIIFRHGSRFLFRISQFKIIYLNTALCKCAFCGPQLFSTWATVKSY